MPLDLEKVHVFKVIAGTETLVSTNPYRRFERRVGEKRTDPVSIFIVQGGVWYDLGGHELPVGTIPDWVWDECRAMTVYDRAMYRIVLPEEAEKGHTIPTFDEAEEFPSTQAIWSGLMTLDKDDPTHWTKEGLPDLAALSQRLGVRISRRRITAVAPRFVRPG